MLWFEKLIQKYVNSIINFIKYKLHSLVIVA